jgi:AraC-like DNA-binding protein/effector-binding domain-containing protein
MPLRQVQPAIAFAAQHLEEDLALKTLAAKAGISKFHLHRLFCGVVGETPKRFTLRLRLNLAAAMLLGGKDSILNVALASGFQSHEVFCRAFRRRFGMTPRAYRERGFINRVNAAQTERHAALAAEIGPCAGLYRTMKNGSQRNGMTYLIEKKELQSQAVLIARRRVRRSKIARAIAEVLPHVFEYAQQRGLALAGQPFTRYREWGPGLLTIEAGMQVAPLSESSPETGAASGDDKVMADTLPGGPAAVTTHSGPYENLPDAYAAIQEWMDSAGLVAAGAPWEVYVTDPADYADPRDWRTDVIWPLSSSPTQRTTRRG